MYGWEGIQAGDGPTLMLAGMVVVFSALLLLLVLMKGLKKLQDARHARAQARADARQRATAAAAGVADEPGIRAIEAPDGHDISGVEIAAIALTLLFEQEQVHDNESLVLTLQGLPKPYSNWWQSRIDPAWKARVTTGRPTSLQTQDPERGPRV